MLGFYHWDRLLQLWTFQWNHLLPYDSVLHPDKRKYDFYVIHRSFLSVLLSYHISFLRFLFDRTRRDHTNRRLHNLRLVVRRLCKRGESILLSHQSHVNVMHLLLIVSINFRHLADSIQNIASLHHFPLSNAFSYRKITKKCMIRFFVFTQKHWKKGYRRLWLD